MASKKARKSFWRRERHKAKASMWKREPKRNPRKVGHGPN